MTTTELDELIERARSVTMTAAEREEQRRSFVFGNTSIENERMTRELVDQVAKNMAAR